MRRLGVVAASLLPSLSGGAACAEPGGQAMREGLGQPAVTIASSSRAARGEPEPAAVLAPLWTFHAGAPLRAGAGVGAGGIAVGSSDGYLHALRPDGAYRWSFTVKGAVVATPLVDGRGGVYVATSSRKLYALTPNGTLAFTMPLAGVALDPLRWKNERELLIATQEGVAYAITTGGVTRAAVALKESLTTPPLPLGGDRWLVGGALGDVFTLDGWRPSRARLASSPVLALVARGAGYVGLSADGVFWPGQSPKQPAQQLGCGPGQVIVVAPDGGVGTLDGKAVVWRGDLDEPLSAAPICARDGSVLLPLASGVLAVMSLNGRMRRYSLGSSALFTPAIDWDRGQLVVSSADGRIQALQLEIL